VGGLVVDLFEQRDGPVVVCPAAKRYRSLPHLRQHHRDREHLDRMPLERQAVERGDGDDHRPVLWNPLESRPDVPAKVTKREVGSDIRKLHPTSGRAGRDDGARRKILERSSNERVAWIGTLWHRGDRQAGIRRRGGQIFRRVHGDVSPILEDGAVHLGRKHTLSSELRHRNVALRVAERLDDHELDGDIETSESLGYELAL
jgi:hypothetical protein